MKAGRGMVRRTRRFAIAAVAVLALVLVVSSVPVAQAQNTEPPLGDCWGGVFPEDPLHCYALEQAEREKLIDVTALYVAPGGGPLYVWLNQTGPVSDEVNAFLKTKSQEFYARWPNLAPHLWVEAPEMSHVLPPPAGYEDIVLHIGGEAARRQQRGGASWRQIWPTSTDRNGVRSAGGFDVSGVNTTDFPEVDCRYEALNHACELWKEYPSLGIAGVVSSYSPPTVHVQLKNVPAGEAEIEALEERLYPCHATIGRCAFVREGVTYYQYKDSGNTFDVELIRVSYGFGEFSRWAVILDRFALSAGNTIGITGARVGRNNHRPSPSTVYRLHDLQYTENSSEYRTTIRVGALDVPGAVQALPRLLPQLGIPVDAVGIVSHADRRAFFGGLTPANADGPDIQPAAKPKGGDGLPVGAIAGAASLVAVVALGAVVAWRRRA